MAKKVIVIGSGFAGMATATFLSKTGWDTTILEQQPGPGGRAGQLLAQGFAFDKGPSWYWMPDVFERYFQQFGKRVSDYYSLQRLDPSYRIYESSGPVDIPAGVPALKELFERWEPGAAARLDAFLREAAYKYRVGMERLVFKPGRSLTEFLDWGVIQGIFRLDVFSSMKSHVNKYFKHPSIRRLLEFPVLFLGALPENTPALYSLMNYADMEGGTWYPQGGMYSIVEAMAALAREQGVRFQFDEKVTRIRIENGRAAGVETAQGFWQADVVVSGADYHHTESSLLPPAFRSYTEKYWDSRHMAPSCLLYYVGLNKKLENIRHHSLFFDTAFDRHAQDIYTLPSWPENPLFYLCAPSVTDSTIAPPGCENLFFLIPVAAGLGGDSPEVRDRYFELLLRRLEHNTGSSIDASIVYKSQFSQTDFIREYNSYKGNAYGLA
ncbi:MAG: phytoene desaturase, partial [Bacteroidetes bacterium]|nr:phytoene desaturase [Bacteroidota bacterium]